MKQWDWMAGFGAGAGLMYLLDPDRGRRRRAIARDKFYHQARIATRGMDIAARDAGHRLQGAAARTRSRLLPHEIDDTVLVARVRTKLGRWVSHPHAIEVIADDGVVTLKGMILESELDGLLREVPRIHGVKEVQSELKAYEIRNHVPSLQGGERKRSKKRFFLGWSPATRLAVTVPSTLLAAYAIRKRVA